MKTQPDEQFDELGELYADMKRESLTPLWQLEADVMPWQPKPKAVPWLLDAGHRVPGAKETVPDGRKRYRPIFLGP